MGEILTLIDGFRVTLPSIAPELPDIGRPVRQQCANLGKRTRLRMAVRQPWLSFGFGGFDKQALPRCELTPGVDPSYTAHVATHLTSPDPSKLRRGGNLGAATKAGALPLPRGGRTPSAKSESEV